MFSTGRALIVFTTTLIYFLQTGRLPTFYISPEYVYIYYCYLASEVVVLL